jgi:hypothetical protein
MGCDASDTGEYMSCTRDRIPPNADFLMKTFYWQGVQFFVVVPTVHRGTLGGAYRRTYPHLHARYRGWVGGVCGTFAVLSRLLGIIQNSAFGGIRSRVHDDLYYLAPPPPRPRAGGVASFDLDFRCTVTHTCNPS